MVSPTPIRSVSALSMVFIGVLFLAACGPIQANQVETMVPTERTAYLQALPTDNLCRKYTNAFIQPQTESQIASILQSRGVKVCETTLGTRFLPGAVRSKAAQVSDDLGERRSDSKSNPTNTQLTLSSEPGSSFKGVALGMSVDRFMQMEFPDRDRPPAGHTKIPRSFRTQCDQANGNLRHCWFEAWGKPYGTCEMDMAGIFKHLNRGPGQYTGAGTIQWANENCYMRIDVGYGGSSPNYGSDITYIFFDNRLMAINIDISPAEVQQLIPKLVSAYGEPTAATLSLVQNAFGASFENLIVHWDYGETTVLVKRYDGRTDEGYFRYTHSATAGQFRTQKAKANSSAAKDF